MGKSNSAEIDTYLQFICSLISLLGSLGILASCTLAYIARSNGNREREKEWRATRINSSSYNLIRNLAAADLIWFSASFIMACYWIFADDGYVPTDLCTALSLMIIYARIASLMWTCVISFDVYKQINTRRKRRATRIPISSENRSTSHGKDKTFIQTVKSFLFDIRYHIFVNIVALPDTLLVSAHRDESGCDPGYESLGEWIVIIFVLAFPIVFGLCCQLFVYIKVRDSMSNSAYPQSVRKRRQRIMYDYILVSTVCWAPTVILYIAEACGLRYPGLDIGARACLYTSGFLNFLAFGMHDPVLIKAFRIILTSCGLTWLLSKPAPRLSKLGREKVVMFEEDSGATNADIAKDKREMIKHHRLTVKEKEVLYKMRPDLNPNPNESDLSEPLLTQEETAYKHNEFDSRLDNITRKNENKTAHSHSYPAPTPAPSRSRTASSESAEERSSEETDYVSQLISEQLENDARLPTSPILNDSNNQINVNLNIQKIGNGIGNSRNRPASVSFGPPQYDISNSLGSRASSASSVTSGSYDSDEEDSEDEDLKELFEPRSPVDRRRSAPAASFV